MLLINCPSHGRQVLVTESRVRRLTNTDSGILLDIECWCGTHVALLTGRRTAARSNGRSLSNAA
jgi:hypothetical protein